MSIFLTRKGSYLKLDNTFDKTPSRLRLRVAEFSRNFPAGGI